MLDPKGGPTDAKWDPDHPLHGKKKRPFSASVSMFGV